MFTALVPTVFYADLSVGLDLFVDGIGMDVLHRDDDLVMLQKGACKLMLERNAELAAGDRPQLVIETDSIDADHASIAARRPDLLHPNPVVRAVTERDWGAREFALLDETTVCVVFRQWL